MQVGVCNTHAECTSYASVLEGSQKSIPCWVMDAALFPPENFDIDPSILRPKKRHDQTAPPPAALMTDPLN